MNSQTQIDNNRIQAIKDYFRKVDENDPTLLDMFADEVQFFFPKFGVKKGKSAVMTFGQRIGSMLKYLKHDINGLNFLVAGDTIVVEGREWGEMRDGTAWPDGTISQGLFCNVFVFNGMLMQRVYIYVDPDYANADTERLRIFQ